MGEKKKKLELDQYDCGVLFHSLNDERNKLLGEEKPTDAVDDLLLEVIGLMEQPEGKKRRRGGREER
ncbi:MAG: hypothetical protein IJ733_08490 [Lachnospiraceae bacterium]|nr:hypothetical protein [Lachnospiraceae bacterium]